MTFPNLSIYHRIQHSGGGGSSAFSFTFDSTWSFLPSFPRSFVCSAAASSQFAPEQYYLFSLAFAAFSEARTPRVLQPLPPPSFSLPFPIPCFLSEPRPRYITASSVGSKEDQDLESAFFDPFHYWNHQGSTGLTYLVIIPISGQWTQSLATGAGASRRGCHAR